MSDKDYKIPPPPKDAGEEPLFRVVYEIDVNAADERRAAEQAWQMMRVEDAFGPVLMVLDAEGKQAMFDLSECPEFNKVTTGFVVQKYRRGNTGKFTCIHQEFIAGDQVDYKDIDGNAITPPEHDYQPFNMSFSSSAEIAGSIEDVLLSIDVGGEQSRQFATEIDILKKVLKALDCSVNQPKTAKLGFLEAQLLEACKVITSYTTDLLYRLDDQININDVEEIQQAKDVIDRYKTMATQSGKFLIDCFISEQCSDVPRKKLPVNIMAEQGKLWVQPVGFSDKTSADGHGWPIALEIWQGRLRLIIFDDINTEEPKIIDLENAKETSRDN